MLMVKIFDRFEDGLREMKEASFSIDACLGGAETQEEACLQLAKNVYYSQNGYRYDVGLIMEGRSVEYTTSGGLEFGWINLSDHNGDGWKFFVRHPYNKPLHESTLLQAFAEKGWRGERERDEIVNSDEWSGDFEVSVW